MYVFLAFLAWWLLSGAAVGGIYHILNPRAYDRRTNARSRRAEEAAAERGVAFYQHCKDIAEGKPSPGPFQALVELNAD